jgi:hypothetical protein
MEATRLALPFKALGDEDPRPGVVENPCGCASPPGALRRGPASGQEVTTVVTFDSSCR